MQNTSSADAIANSIVAEMQLWRPQKEALLVMSGMLKAGLASGLDKTATLAAMLQQGVLTKSMASRTFDLQEELSDNSTHYPSLGFRLATGAGKTKLMAAAIVLLYRSCGKRDFLVLSKGSTVYRKHLVEDFDPLSGKYAFRGARIAEIATFSADDLSRAATWDDNDRPRLYIYNIEKLYERGSGGVTAFRHFNERLGASPESYISSRRPVLLIDEAHNVRGEVSVEVLNNIQPLFAFEFTATPIIRNIVYSFGLGEAIHEQIVKRPVIHAPSELDELPEERLSRQIRSAFALHERKKLEMEAFLSLNPTEKRRVPKLLISTASIDEGRRVEDLITSVNFMNGYYGHRTLFVHSGPDSSQIDELLAFDESLDLEVVIHVNRLKEGWDVKNVYTILPLRASISVVLTEQTLGRGLRLPFGRRLSSNSWDYEGPMELLAALDRLEVVSHERYEAVVQQAASVLADLEIKTFGQEAVVHSLSVVVDKPELLIVVRRAKASVSTVIFDVNAIQPSFEDLSELSEEVKARDLESGIDVPSLVNVSVNVPGSLEKFFSLAVLEGSDLFGRADIPEVMRLVSQYLKLLSAKSVTPKTIVANRGKVVKDILNQISAQRNSKTSVRFASSEDMIGFIGYTVLFNDGATPKSASTVSDDEAVDRFLLDYRRTPFSAVKFDSLQEKWLADSLDVSQEVRAWIRPYGGQLSIETPFGGYRPDIIAETIDGVLYVFEVKQRSELSDPRVLAKAMAARDWLAVQGRPIDGRYLLLPHDSIERGMTMREIKGIAVRIP